MLRRTIDMRFVSLDDMTRIYGRIPFEVGPQPQPLKQLPPPQHHSPNREFAQKVPSPARSVEDEKKAFMLEHQQKQQERNLILERIREEMGLSVQDFSIFINTQPHIIMQMEVTV